MLTTSPQILKKLQSYKDRNFFSYSSDFQTITLNCDLYKSWINDDEFFRNIFFGGPDLNDVIVLHLTGAGRWEVSVQLESRSVPNITHYLWSLGYKPDIYVGFEAGKTIDEERLDEILKLDLSDPVLVAEILSVKEKAMTDIELAIRCDEIIDEKSLLSTSQPKTTKKRK